MNKLILILLLLFFISTAEAQDSFSDSLTKVVTNAKSDSTKVNALIELAKYEESDLHHFDTAVIILNNALTICGQKKLYAQQAQTQFYLSIAFYNQGKPVQGDSLLQNAIVFSRHHQLKAQEADLLLVLSAFIGKKDSVQLLLRQTVAIAFQNNLVKQQIHALARMARFIAPGKPDSAKALFAEALSISRRNNFYEDELYVLQSMADTYASHHWGDSATYFMQNAMNTAHIYGLVTDEMDCLSQLSSSESGYFIKDSLNTYYERLVNLCRKYKRDSSWYMQLATASFQDVGNYLTALQISLSLLQMHRAKNDSANIQLDHMLIGLSYQYSLEYKKAITSYREATKYNHTNYIYLAILEDFSRNYLALKQNDSARYYADSCYKTATRLFGSESEISGVILDDLGIDYLALDEDSLAHDYLRRSYVFFTTAASDYSNYCTTTSGLASYFKKGGNGDSSYYYARLCLTTAHDKGFLKFVISSSLIVADYFLKKHNVDSAYYFQQVGFDAYKSLYNHESTSEFQNMAFAEQQKEQALANEKQLAEEKYKSNLKLYGLLSVLAAGVLVGIVVYRNSRQRKRSYDLLKKQKSEIDLQKIKLEDSIKELKSTQAQLIQSEKMASLGELTAGIAHEIQNPLNFVNNFSELSNELLDEMKEEISKGNYEDANAIADDVKQNLEKINHHGKRADAIVKGMLQHSRQTKGVKEATDINALCDEYLRLSYHGLRAKDKSFNSDFKMDFDETIGKINIVPQDMGRVLLNLFNNSFYAVNEKKKTASNDYKPIVSVQTKKLNDKIEIVVKDNGNGIPQSIIDKIFQPFFTTKPTGQGTGLGLSLSYDIITKEHNGTIKVESKENKSSTFVIQLAA